MGENIVARIQSDSDSDEGIIIPNPYLYNSTYFYLPLTSNVSVAPNSTDNLQAKFGYFKDPD